MYATIKGYVNNKLSTFLDNVLISSIIVNQKENQTIVSYKRDFFIQGKIHTYADYITLYPNASMEIVPQVALHIPNEQGAI